MKRKIIVIDEEKCNGCGACATACHEEAIGMVNGKAKLLKEEYCDGLGDCLPACPTGAISFTEREAAAYDEKAVVAHKQETAGKTGASLPTGCPGKQLYRFERKEGVGGKIGKPCLQPEKEPSFPSALAQWPCQIKLVPVNAPFFSHAKLLIAADCTAYAYAAMHRVFMQGRITLIGCPKLDEGDYSEKLTEIFARNEIASVTVVRMEVPCCGGLENAVKKALRNAGKMIPWQVVTLSLDGRILEST